MSFEIEFEDCGITYPDGTVIGSFNGRAFFDVEYGMAVLLDIELAPFHPKRKAFTRKSLNRFDANESWLFDGIAASIKRQHATEIEEAIERARAERRDSSFTYQSQISAGRTP